MQDTPGQIEPGPSERQDEARAAVRTATIWTARVLAAAYLAGVIYGLWLNDETRLVMLHRGTVVLHRAAAMVGECGIRCEQAYYRAVEDLRP